jgi:hypothetical protein
MWVLVWAFHQTLGIHEKFGHDEVKGGMGHCPKYHHNHSGVQSHTTIARIITYNFFFKKKKKIARIIKRFQEKVGFR